MASVPSASDPCPFSVTRRLVGTAMCGNPVKAPQGVDVASRFPSSVVSRKTRKQKPFLLTRKGGAQARPRHEKTAKATDRSAPRLLPGAFPDSKFPNDF